MEGKPTHEQAQLHLQVYDVRREARLRQARDWFAKDYLVNFIEDAMRVAAPGTEAASFAGMVVCYWEQACALLNYGLLPEDFFLKPAENFSRYGSRSSRSSRDFASESSTNSSSRTWKEQPSAMSLGRSSMIRDTLRRYANSRSRRANSPEHRQRPD
jgi:hypothetical protein